MPHKAKHRTSPRREKKVQAPPAAPVSSGTGETQPAGVASVKAAAPQAKLAATGYRPGTSRSGTPANTAAIGPLRYPYLTNELKWIGIFALVIIVVLVVLGIVLPHFLT